MQNSPKNFVIIDGNVYFYDFFGFDDFRLTDKAKEGSRKANQKIKEIENVNRQRGDISNAVEGDRWTITTRHSGNADEIGGRAGRNGIEERGAGEGIDDLGVRQSSEQGRGVGKIYESSLTKGDNNRGLSEEQQQHAAKEFVASIAENGDFLKHRNIFQKIYDSILSFLGKHGINFGSRSKAVFTKKYIESLLRDAYKTQREGENVIDSTMRDDEVLFSSEGVISPYRRSLGGMFETEEVLSQEEYIDENQNILKKNSSHITHNSQLIPNFAHFF